MKRELGRAVIFVGFSALMGVATAASLMLARALGVRSVFLFAVFTLPALGLIGWGTRAALYRDPSLDVPISPMALPLFCVAFAATIAVVAFIKGDHRSALQLAAISTALGAATPFYRRRRRAAR